MIAQALRLVVAGVVVGLLAVVPAVRLLGSQLFGVQPMDAPTLIVVPVLLCAITVAASMLPLSRATKVSAVVALRGQ